MLDGDHFRPLRFEPLEARQLLAVTETFAGGVLTVNLNAASDTATLSATAAASGGAQSIQLAGTGFTTQTFSGTTSIVINYLSTGQSVTLDGSTAIGLSGALTVDDSGNSTGETLVFANTTTYSFGSVGIWSSETTSVGTVEVNDSLATSAGTLAIGTGSASTSPIWSQVSPTGTISAAGGDVDISVNTTLPIDTPISDSAGTVRLVSGSGISETSTLSSLNLSATAASGNIVLEQSNAVSGTAAFTTTATTYSASNGLTFNDSDAATVGATSNSLGSFAGVTGITVTNGDVNLQSAGLSLTQSIVASSGNVRLSESAAISQSGSGTITAAGLSMSNSAGNDVLELANAVGTLAFTNATSFLTLNDGAAALTIGSIAAAASAIDPSGLFTAVTGVSTSSEDVNLASGGVTINSPVNLGTGIRYFRLVVSGSVTQSTTGIITATFLSVSISSGNVVLESANQIEYLGANDTLSGSFITLNDGVSTFNTIFASQASATEDPKSLFKTISGVTTTNGDLNIEDLGAGDTHADIVYNAPISVGTATVRIVVSGDVLQDLYSITAGALSINGYLYGETDTGVVNSVGTLAVTSPTSSPVTFDDSTNALTVGSVAAAGTTEDPDSLFAAVSGITTAGGDGGHVNLFSGGLSINQPIAAGAGTVRLVSSGAISQTSPGTITASSLSISNSTGNLVLELPNDVGTLAVSNSAPAGAVTLNDTTKALTVGTVAAATAIEDPNSLFAAITGIATSNGDVNLESGALAIDQAIAAGTGTVRLVSSGTISQTSPGTITAGALAMSSATGRVVLELSNDVGTLAASNSATAAALTFNNSTNALTVGSVAAGTDTEDPSGLFGAIAGITTSNGDVNLESGSLAINQAIAAGTSSVRFVAAGNVSQASPGTITAAGLSTSSSSGNVVLELSNDIGTLAAIDSASAGAITLNNNTNALAIGAVAAASSAADPNSLFGAVTGITTTNGDVNLKSSSLAINQALAAGTGSIRLILSSTATEGAAGTVGASGLSISSATSAVLEAANTVSTLATSMDGTLSFNNGNNSLTAGTVAAASTTVDPSGLFESVSGIYTNGGSQGDINLKSGGLSITEGLHAGASDNIRLVETGTVTQTTSGNITTSGLSITTTTGNVILENSGDASTSTLAMNNASSGGVLEFNVSNSSLIIGSIAAASSSVDPAGIFGVVSGLSTNNGDMGIKAGDLTINNAISAGTGNIRWVLYRTATQTATITAAELSISYVGIGGTTVLESANDIGTLAAYSTLFTDPYTLNDGSTPLVIGSVAAASPTVDTSGLFGAVSGITTVGADVNLKSGGLTINSAISIGTGILRLVQSGSLTQATTGTITAGGLSISDSTGNLVLEAANAVGTLAASNSASGDAFTLNNNTTALTVGSVAAAGSSEDPSTLFVAMNGISTSSGDVNLKSAGLTISNSISAGTGSVRLVESAAVGQSAAITAAGLSVSDSGTAVLESSNNVVGTFAASVTTSTDAVTFNDGTNPLTIGSFAAEPSTVDPSSLFGTVTGVTTINGDANLKSGGLSISQPVSLGTGNVRLVESAAVSQTAAITSAGLSVSLSTGGATLGSANDVGTLAASDSGPGSSGTFNDGANALIVGTIAAAPTGADPSSLFGALSGITTTDGGLDIESDGLTTNNNIQSGGGAISLVSGGTNTALAANGNVVSNGGTITLQATGNVTIGTSVTVNSGSGVLLLGADLTTVGTGDDGIGTLSIGSAAAVTSTNSSTSAITLRGAAINIDTSSQPAWIGGTSAMPTAAGVVIQSSVESLPMQIGGTNNGFVAGINLTSAELAQIETTATGTITIGDPNQTGNITLTTATPATTPGAALDVLQSATGSGQIILQEGTTGGTALNGNGGTVTLSPGAGGIQAAVQPSGIALTSLGFTASGPLSLTLGFAPTAGTQLTMVNNTATPAASNPISGTFSNLPQGGTLTASYLGTEYTFQANYEGGDGNDLVLTEIGTSGPAVIGAFVSGTSWNSAYLSVLDSAGLGSSEAAGQGFELASGSNQLSTTLPWSNLNQISIAFSEAVNVSQSSLTLYNSSNTAVYASAFSYNSAANMATWQFATSLVANQYVMNLAAVSVTDSNGMELDGAWTTSVSTFSTGSGNGTPGGDFNFYFNVLPGDVTSGGSVNNSDVLTARLQAGSSTTATNYRLDATGAGSISNADVLLERLAAGTNISEFATPNLPPQSMAQPADVATTAVATTAMATTAAASQPEISTTANSGSSAASGAVALATLVSAPSNALPSNQADTASTTSETEPGDASSTTAPLSSVVPAAPISPSVSSPGAANTPETAPVSTLSAVSTTVSVAVPAATSGTSAPGSTAQNNNIASVTANERSDSAAVVFHQSAPSSSAEIPSLSALSALVELSGGQLAPAVVDAAMAITTDAAWSPTDRSVGRAALSLPGAPAAVFTSKILAKAREYGDGSSAESSRTFDLAFNRW